MRTIPTVLVLFFLICTRAFAGPVDVNTADADALAEALTGVGPKLAAAIVDYRESNGPFRAAEDLLGVKGIGQKVIERNREDILFGDQSSQLSN